MAKKSRLNLVRWLKATGGKAFQKKMRALDARDKRLGRAPRKGK